MAAAASTAVSSTERPAGTAPGEMEEARWRRVLALPCELAVDLPLPGVHVADFLKLKPGSVLPAGWRLARNVPLRVNGTLIGWAELEGSGGKLAVRLTELA